MKIDYNTFKYSTNSLEKLQNFKVPLTRIYENFICSYSLLDQTDESLCEFFLIGAEKEIEVKDLDKELEETAEKLAHLLYLKEQDLKDNVIQYTKK